MDYHGGIRVPNGNIRSTPRRNVIKDIIIVNIAHYLTKLLPSMS